jgi:hypothetical protein
VAPRTVYSHTCDDGGVATNALATSFLVSRRANKWRVVAYWDLARKWRKALFRSSQSRRNFVSEFVLVLQTLRMFSIAIRIGALNLPIKRSLNFGAWAPTNFGPGPPTSTKAYCRSALQLGLCLFRTLGIRGDSVPLSARLVRGTFSTKRGYRLCQSGGVASEGVAKPRQRSNNFCRREQLEGGARLRWSSWGRARRPRRRGWLRRIGSTLCRLGWSPRAEALGYTTRGLAWRCWPGIPCR